MQKLTHVSTVRGLWNRISPILLAVSWLLGMLLASVVSHSDQRLFVDLVRHSAASTPSLVGSYCVVLLPVLLSSFVVSIHEPWLLLAISFLKAYGFFLCAWAVCLAFGQSSWLVLGLYLFSDLCSIPFLYLYWLRHIRNQLSRPFELVILLLYSSAIASFDHFFVAPFLSSLLQ